MVVGSQTFLLVVNIWDGLFKGGLFLISAEVAAELAYPVGEAMSYGFMNAMVNGPRYLIAVIFGTLTFTLDYNPTGKEKQDLQERLIPVYIFMMVFFFLGTIFAIVLLVKAPFVESRSNADLVVDDGLEME